MSQYAKVCLNLGTEETNAFTTSKGTMGPILLSIIAQTEITVAEKKNINWTKATTQPSLTRNSKSIITPKSGSCQSYDIWGMTRKVKCFSTQGGYNLHLGKGAYNSLYSSWAATVLCVADCLTSGNPIYKVHSLQGDIFIDQIIGDIYTHDYANRSLYFWVT